MNSLYNVLLKPVVSEKSIRLQSMFQYTFLVSPQATKIDVKNAVRALYGVIPHSVTMIPVRSKTRSLGRKIIEKRSAAVKAIVSMKESLDVMNITKDSPKKKKTKKISKTS